MAKVNNISQSILYRVSQQYAKDVLYTGFAVDEGIDIFGKVL